MKSIELFLKLQDLIQSYGQHITARDIIGVLEGLKFNILYDTETRGGRVSAGKPKPPENVGGYA